MNPPNEQSVIEAVRKHIKDRHPGGATLEVLTDGIQHEHDWWYVPVRPDIEPARRYEYYEALADAEGALEEDENLTVLLLPVTPN